MRLALVAHNVKVGDGQGRAALELTRCALREGHSVTLFADDVDEALLTEGATLVRVPLSGLSEKVNLLKVREFGLRADALLKKRRGEFDVIQGYGYSLTVPHHTNNSQYCHSAWWRSPVHTAKLSKGAYALYQASYTLANARWERHCYAAAKVLVPASSLVKQELSEIGFQNKRMEVIPNGADLELFYPGEENRAALGLPEGAPLALFAGDIRTPRKNLDTVLKALAGVPGLHLAVVGRKEGSPFPALAQELGVAERVHFLDFRRDIPALMRACDFFVFPSRYEACALVLVEALASGLPIITARSTGGSEFVEDAALILSDPNDVEALSSAMATLSGDPVRREALVAGALKRRPELAWEKIAARYLALFTEVAGPL